MKCRCGRIIEFYIEGMKLCRYCAIKEPPEVNLHYKTWCFIFIAINIAQSLVIFGGEECFVKLLIH